MYNNGLGININVKDMTLVNIVRFCYTEVIKYALSVFVAGTVFIFFYVMQLLIVLYMYMSH